MLYLSMPNTDTRKLSPAAREQLRRVVVKLYESGHTRSQISKDLNLRLTTVGHWVARYKESGKDGLAELGRGRPLGNGRKLTPAQEARIQADIVDKTPDQLRLKFALWSAQAVRLLIKQYFGVVLPDRTVRKYLRRWGFTPQRPVKRAYEQQPKAVQKWLDEDYRKRPVNGILSVASSEAYALNIWSIKWSDVPRGSGEIYLRHTRTVGLM